MDEALYIISWKIALKSIDFDFDSEWCKKSGEVRSRLLKKFGLHQKLNWIRKSNFWPGVKMACKRSSKNECKVMSVKISWRSVKTSHQWNQLFLKKIPNSANVIFTSASLGSRRSDCGDGAKIRKNRIWPKHSAAFGKYWREMGFDCLWGSAIRQNLGTDAGLGKKTMFGISFTEVRDAGFSWIRSRNSGLGPPPLFSDLSVEGSSTVRTHGTSSSYASAKAKCLHFLGSMHFSGCISDLWSMYLRLRLRH